MTPWAIALQAFLSKIFSRQEYWSGLSFHSPGDLLNPGIEPRSLALAGGFFTTESPGKPKGPSTGPSIKDWRLPLLLLFQSVVSPTKRETSSSRQLRLGKNAWAWAWARGQEGWGLSWKLCASISTWVAPARASAAPSSAIGLEK